MRRRGIQLFNFSTLQLFNFSLFTFQLSSEEGVGCCEEEHEEEGEVADRGSIWITRFSPFIILGLQIVIYTVTVGINTPRTALLRRTTERSCQTRWFP